MQPLVPGRWLILCFLLVLCPRAGAQLSSFGNSGFETGDLTGWTTSVPSGASATLGVTSGTALGAGAGSVVHSGRHAFQADVTNPGPGGGYPALTHVPFTATGNSTYMVRFWLWSGGNQSVNRPVMVLHIHGEGPAYDVAFPPSSVGWDEYHFCFKASGRTTISFTFQQRATFNVDDVQVFDQNDPLIDTVTQYLQQWGMQATNSNPDTNIAKTCWTGGDNNITAELPDGSGRIAWFFNDSFAGQIDYSTNIRNYHGYSFVRNYYALETPGYDQNPSTLTPMSTDWKETYFQPSAADKAKGDIMWPNDAITEGSNIQVLLAVVPKAHAPVTENQFATLSPPDYNTPRYTYTPWGEFLLNGGDGYIYIYDKDGRSGYSIARVPYGRLTDIPSWQWWLGGSSWGTKPASLPTVPGLLTKTRCFERIGPDNYMACGDPKCDMQFAQHPWGPWTSAVPAASGPNNGTPGPQMSVGFYYYYILHKELAQNGVYTIGYCDNGGDNKNSQGISENKADGKRVFSDTQQNKCAYAPRYIKTINTLTASPYTTTSYTDHFANSWESGGWQTYGGAWSIGNGTYTLTHGANGGYYSILKGLVETDFTLEAEVSVGQLNGTGNAGLVFRGSKYGYGSDNYNGYGIVLNPGARAQLVRADGEGRNTVLQTASLALKNNTIYHLKVVCLGSSIQIYIGGTATPQISVTDATYASGGVGVRLSGAESATWANFSVHHPE